jgi:UDP-N-acetyl-D-mannosaminuronate dehydrogenase
MAVRIGIVGMGHVGQSMHDLFARHAQIVTFDANGHQEYPEDELAACDAVVVCVDTPMGDDGACDTRKVCDAVQRLPMGRVLLKSTIAPGTTDFLIKATGKQICFSPEYVGEVVTTSHSGRTGSGPSLS